jgi:hypothetical protein
MELLKQIEAKQKCTLVIESCVNKEQLESAHNYVKLYYKKFEDFLGYNELIRMINNKYE